jgi:threonine aldolase
MIDLSSDTATRPSDAMRDAIHKAPVGDDQRGEDPTVNALQDFGCELLGKESALFLPSATQANQIAIRIQTRPGDEVICSENCHIQKYESGGPAVLSGVLLRPLQAPRGIFTADQLISVLNPAIPHAPPSRMVCIENTHNYAGGIVWDEAAVRAVTESAHAHGLATHLDGARLVNAAVGRGCDLAEIAAPFQTVTLCLSKGLGAPAGALLLGPTALINEARRWKHVFGGAMRQAGILAAGGLYALHHHLADIEVDHANAQALAEVLQDIPGIRLDPWPETNIVYFDISATGLTGVEAMARLEQNGVRASGMGACRLRFVTHRDVSTKDIHKAATAIRAAFAN